jgi:hypothetical protein
MHQHNLYIQLYDTSFHISALYKIDLFYIKPITQNRIISYNHTTTIMASSASASASASAAPAPPNGMPSVPEKYNKSNRLPVECGFCDFAACRSYYKQYIPSLTEELNAWRARKTGTEPRFTPSLTQHTINTVLKHRQENILIDREKKTLMAETQPEWKE